MFKREVLRNTYNLIKNNRNIIKKTELQFNERLSKRYECNLFLKREDQQIVRSFKIRGSFNKIYKNKNEYRIITTASAGNHAQGVSYVSNILNKKCKIFLPITTPKQKIDRIKHFYDNDNLELELIGNNVDESLKYSKEYGNTKNALFVHPFDDDDVICGQSTICNEIYEDLKNPDYICVCVGGGGLVSGIGNYLKTNSKDCKLICAEPENANSLYLSLKKNKQVSVKNLDTFVDGAAVKTIGKKNFEIAKQVVDEVYNINKNMLCNYLVDVYQNDGIILEPAGILGLCSLEHIKKDIKGKNVVVVLSGGNNDILRYNEILERSLIHLGLKHYFIVDFNQRPGTLKNFVNNILLNNIDITRFEYLKKNNKERGSVLIGIELGNKLQYNEFIRNLEENNFYYEKLDENKLMYNYLI